MKALRPSNRMMMLALVLLAIITERVISYSEVLAHRRGRMAAPPRGADHPASAA